MRGGWRSGAGRPAQHDKAEQHRQIDIRRWAREGMLTAGRYFGWQWSVNGKKVASIDVRVNGADMVTLIYRWREGGDWHDESIPIRLAKTACHFGGERHWFICPHCDQRAAILYLAAGKWYCRQSLRLAYASQSEDRLDRLYRKKTKLEESFHNHAKPKGMHRKTYDRLRRQWIDTEMAWDEEFTIRTAQLFGLIR